MAGPHRAELDGSEPTEATFNAFAEKYAAALRDHVAEPAADGLEAADGFGRAARESDLSLLQLVGMHLEVRRVIVEEQGIGRLKDMDAFLSTALSAYDDGQPDDGPDNELVDRDRLEWLRGLSDAYLSIAAGPTLDERLAEVCRQATQFLRAADARLEFGPNIVDRIDARSGDEMSARLLGSAGLLTVTAPPGRWWTEAERAALQQLAALISAPINDARRLEFAERAGRVGAVLGGVIDPADVLTRFVGDARAELGAARVAASISGADAPDDLPPEVATALDATRRDGIRRIFDDDPERGPWWVLLPLGHGDPRMGAIALRFDEPQPLDEVQTSFLSDVAGRFGAALERSRAYARERSIRHEVERASERLHDLQALASELARAATRRRVAQVLLRRALVSTGASGGFVATFTTFPQAEVLSALGVFRRDEWSDVSDVVAALPLSASSAASVAVVADVPDAAGARLAAAGLAAILRLPVRSGEREIGALVLVWEQPVGDADVDGGLLEAQVAMAGSALQRAARYDIEHAIADTLQRSLLAMPALGSDRIRWSVLYRAGSAGLAGGDWYDLIEIDDHTFGLVIGDIVGRGVDAAASMGQLRSATRALASRIDDPAALVGALDEYARNTGQGRYSSLAYLVLDASRGMVHYTIAGHPPPVVQRPGGELGLLDEGRGPLLGMPCSRTTATAAVGTGTRLILYTDGLIERRGEPLDVGIARVLDALRSSTPEAGPDAVGNELVERLVPAADGRDEIRDDVAIVVVDLARLGPQQVVDAADLDQPRDDP